MILVGVKLGHLPSVCQTTLSKSILDNNLDLLIDNGMPKLRAPHDVVPDLRDRMGIMPFFHYFTTNPKPNDVCDMMILSCHEGGENENTEGRHYGLSRPGCR